MTAEISIHAPRKGERQVVRYLFPAQIMISIHAPRKGERHVCIYNGVKPINISIHAPRKGERQAKIKIKLCFTFDFNPRSPQGGATMAVNRRTPRAGFQSTLPARGSDPAAVPRPWAGLRISIHAPRKGERPFAQSAYKVQILFQSTLPARGSDTATTKCTARHSHFNPRSPQGGATIR